MLRQGVVQETLAELNAPGGVLPPLHNLPHWSRVNNFDKSRYPKPFLKDRLQPLPNPSDMDGYVAVTTQSPVAADTESEPGSPPTELLKGPIPSQRVLHLERSIHFIQQQHCEILSKLHEEIDDLKRQNKELQFQVVMLQKGPSQPGSAQSRKSLSKQHIESKASLGSMSESVHGVSQPIDSRPPIERYIHDTGMDGGEDLKVLFLEEEIKELKHVLRDERNMNQYLQQLLQATQKQLADRNSAMLPLPMEHKTRSAKDVASVSDTGSSHPAASVPDLVHTSRSKATGSRSSPAQSVTQRATKLPLNATVGPLRVNPEHDSPRAPTVEESELIIKHLQRINDDQAHELNQLKSDLRDVLYSHKWTPDAYLLAKAYVAEEEITDKSHMPRIALKQNSRKLPEVAYLQKDTVSLPALKHTLGNKAVERRKRTQILQRSRVSNPREIAN